MAQLQEHPTVKRFYENRSEQLNPSPPARLEAHWLRQVCIDQGADDVGFVEIGRPEIADQRNDILAVFPRAETLVSLICRMNREAIRSPARSVANVEFHMRTDHVNEVAHRIVAALEKAGVRALNPAAGFPMEMDRYPGKTWVVSHKLIAVAAGLGRMGIHRNVIHPRFGSFVLLGTILIDHEVSTGGTPLDYNPCVECKLCVAACPVGAIHPDGQFDFSACITHNYREFMGGFTDWVGQIADSKGARDYRRRVTDAESASIWQSLSFGANYKSAYCLAVCPAGEEVISPFLTNRKQYLQEVVKPLQDKTEPVYVVPSSDAHAHVMKRFPQKTPRMVRSPLRATSIRGFLFGLRLGFQRNQADRLNATYHFTFTGGEPCKATVIIRDKTIQVLDGHVGTPDIRITADSRTWLGFLAGERSLLWAVVRGRIRIRGSLGLMRAFRRCFPT